MTEALLTERRVAALLAVSVDSIRRLRLAGELPFLRVGRRAVRYRPEAISRWLREREVAAEVAAGDELAQRGREIMASLLKRV